MHNTIIIYSDYKQEPLEENLQKLKRNKKRNETKKKLGSSEPVDPEEIEPESKHEPELEKPKLKKEARSLVVITEAFGPKHRAKKAKEGVKYAVSGRESHIVPIAI